MVEVAPPDGGWGWVVCFACFMTHVLTDGIFYSFGIIFVELLDYYNEKKGNTALIASLAFGICFLSGPITAAISNHFGNRKVVIVGTFVMFASLVPSIFAPKIGYLYVTFAFAGWGFGMVYLPSIVCVTKYFENKRAFAVGLGVSGSGMGTFAFSPLTRVLVDAYTWKGALLIQGALLLNCIACGLVYLPLDHPVNRTKKRTYSSKHRPVDDIELNEVFLLNEIGANKCDNSCDGLKTSVSSQHREHGDTMISRPDENLISNNTHPNDHKTDRENDNTASYDTLIQDDTEIDGAHSSELKSLKPQKETGPNQVCTSSSGDATSNQEEDNQLGLCQEIVLGVKRSFRFRVFTNRRLLLYVLSAAFYGLGYYVPYVYVPVKAEKAGIDSVRSAWLVATIGIANTTGRIIFGFISDKKCINRLMLYNTAVVLCGVGTILCPFFNTFETLILYAAIFGLFSGVTISLTSVIIADFVGTEMLADAMGVMNFFAGIAIFLGPPLAGWLYDITNSYDWTFAAAGIAITVSGTMMYAAPFLRDQRPGKKQ